jgi:hypothetical protein
MKTYKIDSVKATSLRRQLLWSQIAIFIGIFLTFVSIGADLPSLSGIVVVITGGAVVWGGIAYWRSLWNLWEWPGIGLGFAVAIGTALLNALVPLIGMFASFAFFVYVYIELGKQSVEAVRVGKRELFSE